MQNDTQLEQSVMILINQGRLDEAREALMAAQNDRPGNSGILLMLGTVEAMAGDLTGAKSWLEKSIGAGSHNPICYLQLGNIHRKLKQNNEAIRCYRKAVEIQPGFAQAHLALAGLFKLQRNFVEASQHLCAVLRAHPNADGYAELAQLYEHINRTEDASDAARRALELQPGNVTAMIVLGNVAKRTGNYQQAEELFRRVVADAKGDEQTGSASMDLGQVLDRQGRYSEAFATFEAGNAAWSRIADERKLDRQEMRNRVARNTAFAQPDIGAHWEHGTAGRETRRSPIFFVGFPRSGTTLLERVLCQNPRIVSSQERPLVSWLIQNLNLLLPGAGEYPRCLGCLTSENIETLRDAYWRKAEQSIGTLAYGAAFLDKLPLNIVDLELPARIFPDSRILVALRDPRDVCLSCFMQAFALNNAMVHFLDLEATARLYSEVMGLWLKYRSVLPIKWHEYRYEDLVDDFDPVTRDVFDFLDLEYPEKAADYYVTTRNNLLATPSYQDVSSPIYSRAKSRWKNYEAQLAPVMHYLEPFIKEFGYPL